MRRDAPHLRHIGQSRISLLKADASIVRLWALSYSCLYRQGNQATEPLKFVHRDKKRISGIQLSIRYLRCLHVKLKSSFLRLATDMMYIHPTGNSTPRPRLFPPCGENMKRHSTRNLRGSGTHDGDGSIPREPAGKSPKPVTCNTVVVPGAQRVVSFDVTETCQDGKIVKRLRHQLLHAVVVPTLWQENDGLAVGC